MNQSTTEHDPNTILDEYLTRHQAAFEALANPVVVTDIRSNIVFTNRAMRRLHGYGAHLINELSSSLKKRFPGGLPQTETTDRDELEIFIPSAEKYLLVYRSPVVHQGMTIGNLNSLVDITAIRSEEKEHRELIDIYAHAVNDIKFREQKAQTGREAFLNMLEDLNDSYKELEQLFLRLISVMINALDAKSPWTKGHSERVSLYAEQIAREMLIDSDDIKNIRLAGLLHDIGKIGTYDYLLDKPGRLTPEEYELVKRHPAQGAAILKDIKQLLDIIPLIEYHHEKVDGTGYPYGLKGEKIPVGARILHVADSFDSMTSDRPYRNAPGIEFALSELHKYKGSQFDELVVNAFMRVLEKQMDLSRVSQYSK